MDYLVVVLGLLQHSFEIPFQKPFYFPTQALILLQQVFDSRNCSVKGLLCEVSIIDSENGVPASPSTRIAHHCTTLLL